MKFSIITVCFNAEKVIDRTIESLLSQSYINWEYIIKDGESRDNTLNVVNRLVADDERTHIVSSKDEGIFDAMNQALAMAKGDYVYFLNAGDVFCNENILRDIATKLDEEDGRIDVIYGDQSEVSVAKNTTHVRKYSKFNETWLAYSLGYCICHQSMFSKRSLYNSKMLDIHYKVIADKEWQMYELKHRAKFEHIDLPIANVLVEGFSNSHVKDLERETLECLGRYYYVGKLIFGLTLILKKSKILHALIVKADAAVNVRND